MPQMAFAVFGVGFKGFSAGQVILAISPSFLYKGFVQGTGGSGLQTAGPFDFTNDLPDGAPGKSGDGILGRMDGASVSMEIPDVFAGQGIAAVIFTVFDQSGANPVYKFTRRPTLRGINSSGLAINTNGLSAEDTTDPVNQSIFDNLMAGNLIINPETST